MGSVLILKLIKDTRFSLQQTKLHQTHSIKRGVAKFILEVVVLDGILSFGFSIQDKQ